MIKIRIFKEIEEEKEINGPVLFHNEKAYECILSQKCDSTLSPYKAFDQFGISIQNGNLFTIQYEKGRNLEAYCFLDGYLIVIPDIHKSNKSNGKLIERDANLEGRNKITKELKTTISSVSSVQKEDREAFRRYVSNFICPYSVMSNLNLKKDDVEQRKKEQMKWELEHPEVKKNQDKDKEECI